MKSGIFLPSNISANYLATQRTQEGGYAWDESTKDVSIGKQAALQTLNKEYSNTINNAYTNYLAASRGIRGAGMGEGYKEAYIQKTQEALQQQISEVNMNSANVRSQLEQGADQQINDIYNQYKMESDNMNRVSSTAGQYFEYLKEVSRFDETDKTMKFFLDDTQRMKTLDDMYGVLFDDLLSAKLKGYKYNDEDALGYSEWVNKNLKDNDIDRAWREWLNSGGYLRFKEATKLGIKKPGIN